MTEREWPPGHRLFTEGDLHLQFDPPADGQMPAILLHVDPKQEVATILHVKLFDNDAEALAWFADEIKKRAHWMTDSNSPHTLTMWVVTKYPIDFPDKFVARLNLIGPRGNFSLPGEPLTADTLEELRNKLPDGLHRLPRWAEDDPVIVEVWL